MSQVASETQSRIERVKPVGFVSFSHVGALVGAQETRMAGAALPESSSRFVLNFSCVIKSAPAQHVDDAIQPQCGGKS